MEANTWIYEVGMRGKWGCMTYLYTLGVEANTWIYEVGMRRKWRCMIYVYTLGVEANTWIYEVGIMSNMAKCDHRGKTGEPFVADTSGSFRASMSVAKERVRVGLTRSCARMSVSTRGRFVP